MSKKIHTRLVAVVVVGLRKFHVSTWLSAPRGELDEAPLLELLELRPRLAGETIATFNARAVTSQEMRRAHLVVVNGRVVKSRISERDPVAPDQVAGEYGAIEGSVFEIKGPLEVTVGAAGVTAAIASALGMNPEAPLPEIIARATRLVTAAGQYPNGSVLEAFARALRMTVATGAQPLLERVGELMKLEAGERSARVDYQRLLEQLRAALQTVVTVPGDVGELDEDALLQEVAALVRAREKNLASLRAFEPRPGDGLSLRRGRALLKVRSIELEGENLSLEAIGEAIKLGTGGES